MAAPAQPSARRVRSKSAKARLVTTKMDLDTAMLSHRPDFNKSKRAQSAMCNKTRSEQSQFVLPGFKQEDRLGITHYEEEFEQKKGDMAAVRPSSPTRRNNPHPSEEFMQWKVSNRVLESRQGAIKPQTEDEMLSSGLRERFYGDYSGGNDGDMRTDVPITNVATIRFPGRPQRQPQSEKLKASGLSGTRIQLNPRSATSATKQRLVGATTKSDSTAELLEEWLEEGAKDDEKTVVLDMLKTAATDDVRLKKALHSTLSPAAMPGVEQWLQSASETERKTVANVFEQLSARKRQARAEDTGGRMPPITQSTYSVGSMGRPGHTRRASDPLPVARINPPPMLYRHAMQQFSKTRPNAGAPASRAATRALGSRPNSSIRRSHSHHGGSCDDCEARTMEGAFSRLEIENSKKQAPPVTPMPAMLWHMYSKRDPTPNVVHRGSIFSLPNKYRGTHFDLTPEWPTA